MNLTFDEWYARPTLCRECCEPVPSSDVDIDDEGQTVATCATCRAEEPANPTPSLHPTKETTMTDERDWCEDYSEIVRLYRWLQASDEHALPLEGVIDFLEKPWHWQPERELMLAEAST